MIKEMQDILWLMLWMNIALDSKKSKVDEDIAMYITHEVKSSKFTGEFRTTIMETLKKDAHGQFCWVECQLRELEICATPKITKTALQNLPKDLSETYEQALKQIEKKTKDQVEDARNLLLWLLYAYEPISVNQIKEILAIDIELDLIISSTLVTQGLDGIVQLAHSSVKEFLISNYEMKDILHPEWTETDILSIHNAERERTFHIFNYAVQNWPVHAKWVEDHNSGGKAQSLIKKIMGEEVSEWQRV
ncbi:hypothetical protein J3R30DRAFT_3406048 [Lentinula aciculospora]|uniref:Uncharacterized protein n=1 Tax=Lentinula aciculospora TaxID=153920 RepID=A0A9W9A669_9AGAR|nr:hypothetical protein J3R30DRAFT_3406048 [Lentinula aciculospora]